MNALRSIFILFIVIVAQPAFAEEGTMIPDDIKNYIGYGAIMLVLIVLLITVLMLLRTFKVLSDILAPVTDDKGTVVVSAVVPEAAKPKPTIVEKLLSLKPLSEEKSLIIEHDYDGIQELDNPTPAWFMGLFYISIAFAVIYMLTYHVFNLAPLQDQEYVNEITVANKEKEAYLAKSADRVDENTVKVSADPAVLSAGQTIYAQNCMPCHGDKGQGMVGPNLTDDYWLHGGTITDVFKTIKYGVQAKGMPNWEKQLSPKQIADVSSFIMSLHGTNPANAKEAQGEKQQDNPAGGATAMVTTDKSPTVN
ncbi:cytochrome C [Mucilaginibacter hurinus]|uniref:Cytochrome C n=1 Tax=Mucilaginibacter hurinus TaxID=2201324 RepID=A0A367GPQ3_9SPHI|nr:cbb3-type cytochrome c oxidase N-terminal domain-containing protein [Mucilaginibacter hurinus]RCH55442.1 cytochrome C [Mucilaginibacter hurinus]